MIILQLAFRNVIAAGLRTWLNLFILSLTLFTIIALQGMYSGLYEQMATSRIEDELGQGQFWHKNYDPFDPLTLEDSHAEIPPFLNKMVQSKETIPVLVVSAAIYPSGGRISQSVQSVILKGIPANQDILKIPTAELNKPLSDDTFPIIIGKRMAKQTGLNIEDILTIRWRTADGAFDALEFTVVHIFETIVPAVDQGQVWMPLETLQDLFQTGNHATFLIAKKEQNIKADHPQWPYQSLDSLLSDTKEFVRSKSAGGSFMYGLLMFLAMIAIFDTQALAIFKRKKEIGTFMALGMAPSVVLRIFLCEGLLQGVLATVITLIYGIPILWYFSENGIAFPSSGDQYGLAISNILYPTYSLQLVIGTFIIVMIILLIVSYWPTRHITKLLPSNALRGR